MLSTIADIQNEVLIRNNRTTTDSFITDTILNDWIREAHLWACGVHKWPFTEGRVSTTYASLVTNEDGWLTGQYPEGWKPDSIRLLTIGGKRVDKKNFYQFQEFLEDNSAANDRVYTDFGGLYYINPNIDVSGTVTAWGQYTPVIDPTDQTSLTLFTSKAEEGNEAIVEKMTSYLKRREHLAQEAELHDQRALAKLEEIWKRVLDEQYAYQPTDGEGMFKRLDLLNGSLREDGFHRDRWE